MARRPRIAAPAVLEKLAAGQRLKEIALENHLEPSSISSVLMFERRRKNCRTNMQLLAKHLERKLKGENP